MIEFYNFRQVYGLYCSVFGGASWKAPAPSLAWEKAGYVAL